MALRHRQLRTVAADDHAAILRMLANRHHALTRLRTQAVCRLHAQLANLTPGGLAGTLSVKRAWEVLPTIHPDNGVTAERKHQAVELLDDVIRLEREVRAVKQRIGVAVDATRTGLLDIFGAGPVVAAIVLGHVGDISRLPSRTSLRQLRRRGSHRSVVGTQEAASAQPPRQPAVEPRVAHHRHRPDPSRHSRARWSTTNASSMRTRRRRKRCGH